jgi:hypothetical protein
MELALLQTVEQAAEQRLRQAFIALIAGRPDAAALALRQAQALRQTPLAEQTRRFLDVRGWPVRCRPATVWIAIDPRGEAPDTGPPSLSTPAQQTPATLPRSSADGTQGQDD